MHHPLQPALLPPHVSAAGTASGEHYQGGSSVHRVRTRCENATPYTLLPGQSAMKQRQGRQARTQEAALPALAGAAARTPRRLRRGAGPCVQQRRTTATAVVDDAAAARSLGAAAATSRSATSPWRMYVTVSNRQRVHGRRHDARGGVRQADILLRQQHVPVTLVGWAVMVVSEILDEVVPVEAL